MQRAHRSAHRTVWRILLIALPALLLLAFGLRRNASIEAPPLRLEAPK